MEPPGPALGHARREGQLDLETSQHPDPTRLLGRLRLGQAGRPGGASPAMYSCIGTSSAAQAHRRDLRPTADAATAWLRTRRVTGVTGG
jgi:hypothetical protein